MMFDVHDYQVMMLRPVTENNNFWNRKRKIIIFIYNVFTFKLSIYYSRWNWNDIKLYAFWCNIRDDMASICEEADKKVIPASDAFSPKKTSNERNRNYSANSA